MAHPIDAGARDQATFAAYGEPIPVADLPAEAANSVGDGDLPAAHSYSNPGYFVVGACQGTVFVFGTEGGGAPVAKLGAYVD